jgi:type I restriction enzyme S subunit
VNWPWVVLGDIARPRQWPTLTKSELSDDGYPVYGANGPIGYHTSYTHEQPTILVGCRGSCGTVHITPPRAYANGNAMALDSLDTTMVDINFAAEFFRWRGFVDVVTGTSQPQIIAEHLRKVRVPVPPLPEQRRVAAILSKAQALRTMRREGLACLDVLAKSIFLAMFGEPRKNAKGWPVYALPEVCSPKQWATISSTDLTTEGYPVYGANGVIGRYHTFNHEDATVLITCRGATCGTINVCEPKSYVTGNSMALDNPDPDLLRIQFLEWALRIRGVGESISGSAQPQITREKLGVIKLPVPPVELQEKFGRRIDALTATRGHLLEGTNRTDALFAALQTRAFNAEL